MQMGKSLSFVAPSAFPSRIKFADQQQMHSMELPKQWPVTVIPHDSKRGTAVNIKISGVSNPSVAIAEGFVSAYLLLCTKHEVFSLDLAHLLFWARGNL